MSGRATVIATLAAVFTAGFVLFTLLDGPIYRAIAPTLESRAHLDGRIWYQIFRQTGSVWTWLVIGLVVLTWDVTRRLRVGNRAWTRGAFVAGAAAVGGLSTELAKLVLGRERPATIETLESGVQALVYQGYEFRGLFAGFVDGSNLGLPSSHAGTAMGGALALALCFPRLAPAAMALALGCGISRLLTGAHFATDVYAGFWLAGILVWWLWRACGFADPIGPMQRKGLRDA